LAHFDDIPIHQLHKADGYQIRNIDDSEIKQDRRDNRGGNESDGDEIANMSLKDQVFHPTWKIRSSAFKKINQLFLTYDHESKEIKKEDEMYGDPENPFDTYGPILEQAIKDQNLTAQFEGLICLHSYCRLGKDIKGVTFACHSYLLDKIQHNKPNLKDITSRILQVMLSRKENIVPELLKRFKSNNKGVIVFSMSVFNQAIAENNLNVSDVNLKMVFKSTHDNLDHKTKEVRDSALQLICYVYQNCEDDISTFCSNIKGLRPVQLKELKEQLEAIDKNQESEYLVKLFDKVVVANKAKEQAPDRSPAGRSKSTDSVKQREPREEGEDGDSQSQVDLMNLLPDNFSEIPYLT